jgi:hypothetical protein
VEGNEKVDEQAKKVITDGGSNTDELPKILCKTQQPNKYRGELKQRAQKLWTKSPQYAWMKNTDPLACSGKFIKLITPLPRKLASILMQLKTGHKSLAK